MKNFLLDKVRLSYFFAILFLIFLIFELFVPNIQFDSGALALFSVNSFLYAFYISPILNTQKSRIEDLHKIAGTEATAIFSMVIGLKKLPKQMRDNIQEMFMKYLDKCVKQHKSGEGEAEYEVIINYCLSYRGEHQEEIDKLLESLLANQQNRTNFSMQISNKVFNNEWIIITMLFGVTLMFVLLLETGGSLVYRILAALLCTSLSMLVIILAKMSSLSHKKAKQIWDPFKKLADSQFRMID